MGGKAKKPKQSLDSDLKRIYADPDGAMPDFTRLEGKPGSRLRSILFTVAVSLFGLGVAVAAGFFLFSRASRFTGDGVQLSVRSDGRLTAGDEEEIVVRYRNDERLPLARASVTLKAPQGFEIVRAEPPSNERGSWTIGAIPAGQEGEIRVRGYVKRELEAALTFQAVLDYRPSDFNADFQKVASHTAVVRDAALALSATGTAEVAPGEDASYVFSYENRSARAIEHARLVIEPLESFIFESSQPKPDENAAMQWTLPKLEAGAKGSVSIRGTFAAGARGSKTLRGRLGLAEDGGLVGLATAETTTNVLKSGLDIVMAVNGSTKPPIASFGETLYFSIRYENAGDVALKDVALSAALPSEPAGKTILDWITLKDELGGKRTGSTIVWTKKELPALASLPPGSKGELTFSVQLIRKPFVDVKTATYVIHAAAGAAIAKTGTVPARQVDTAPLDIFLQSDASFEAFGRYFTEDGVPVGSGPLPPTVGEKTVYRITWIVQNSLHELTDLTATTVLPAGVKWTGERREVEAGSLTFDESGRKATWRLNRLPASVKSVAVNFDVELTPEAEDAEKIVDLTGGSRFEAFDKEVSSVILKTAPAIGTDLLGDEYAAGKGVVKE